MTQQGQALRVHIEALLLSFNNPTSYAENCLLLATARARLDLIEGIWEAICETNDLKSLFIGIMKKLNKRNDIKIKLTLY